MNKSTQDSRETKNWYKDRYQYVLVQRKLLVLVTLLSLASTLATTFVIASLTPLKTVEPFVIQVDQKTGIVQTVDPLTATELTANEAVNNFYIVQYIRARETYSLTDLARNYETVRVMSESGTVYPEFISQQNPNNPNSNTARLGASGQRTVKFRSFTYLNPSTIQARVLIEEKNESGVFNFHRIVTLRFEYVKMALTMEERYLNPLGFRVTSYRTDEEILPR
ncbi:MAG: VirB8/TrbF family protein [Alphaproteobacteria bacterium]|nr:VirB8/TrbF family protein [Alphaproteobacteria bacterium]